MGNCLLFIFILKELVNVHKISEAKIILVDNAISLRTFSVLMSTSVRHQKSSCSELSLPGGTARKQFCPGNNHPWVNGQAKLLSLVTQLGCRNRILEDKLKFASLFVGQYDSCANVIR